MRTRSIAPILALLSILASLESTTFAQQQPKPFEPYSGQPGKDVVWVPTPEGTVAKMLDMAKVTAQDLVMDLGSGDGRTVIEAAKRGARAIGVEYNPEMVKLSRSNAATAKMSERATFVEGDIFETDFSKATVVTLFLLPSLNEKLRPQILNMKPGTRIVSNSFSMGDWQPDESASAGNCTSWCSVMMWIVPAKVEGSWQLGSDTLTLQQQYQTVSGRLGSNNVTEGKLLGSEISFMVGPRKYIGHVDGNAMSGTISGGGTWKATKR
jgi:SAM-dependent methyltransferase